MGIFKRLDNLEIMQKNRAVVQVNPATGIPEYLYHVFADYLTTQGFRVITYN